MNDEEPKPQIEDIAIKIKKDIEERFTYIDKRIDDLGGLSKTIFTVLPILVGVLAAIGAYNFNTERTALREELRTEKTSLTEFKTEIKNDLLKGYNPPALNFLTIDGESLEGRDVASKAYIDGKGKAHFSFSLIHKNSGGPSGKIFVKVYTKKPLRMSSISTDEPDFDFEDVQSFDTEELVSGVSLAFSYNIRIYTDQLPLQQYPCLIKAYYGNGKVPPAKARFNLDFSVHPR